MLKKIFVLFSFTLFALNLAFATSSKFIETMTWIEVKNSLKSSPVVLIPLGTPAKEHGPHLPMNTDLIESDYLRDRVLEKIPNLIVAPTITYNYYSTFTEYTGTISLSYQTSLGVILDTCRVLAKQGFKKFYILNTGIRTLDVLQVAKMILASEGIQMNYLESRKLMAQPQIQKTIQQARGTHADEVETSIMLYIAPQVVNMSKAIKYDIAKTGLPNSGFTPYIANKLKTYSPSGIWGDPTLATKEKGKLITEALVEYLINDIKQFAGK